MTPPTADAALKLVLRVVGGVELCAVPFILFPLGWMDAVHQRLGLGPLPQGVIVEYMARTLSALYAVHGAVTVFLSTDVARYRPAIACLGVVNITLGACLLAVDVAAGCPWMWTAVEGPVVAAGGGLIAWLARRGGPPGVVA